MDLGMPDFRVRKRGLTLLTMVLFALFLLSIACAQPVSSPPPSSSEVSVPPPQPPVQSPSSPQPSSTGKWMADGVISTGEYTGTKTFGDYELHWLSDEQYVYIAMKAKTNGWVSVGVQPGARMKDADIMFGFVKDGKAMAYDLFSTGDFGPHPQDTELGGTNNIVEFGGKEEGGITIIEFKRALNTGDRYDKPLARGVNKIIWSYGSDDSLTPKHSNRGYGEIEL